MKDHSNYKVVWENCLLLCYEYIQKGIILKPEISSFYSIFQGSREEFSIKSRYLHRGFYCPSLALEHIITNAHRGKIVNRTTRTMRLTNRYVFDEENKLRLADTFYPDGSTKTEYIFYEGDIIYGLTFDSYDHMSEISVEQHSEGKIRYYLWACCYYDPTGECYRVSHMLYETYSYDDEGYLNVEFYDMLGNRDDVGKCNKYRFNLGDISTD